MSSATLPSSAASSSTIDDQLRLRIAEDLAGSFKGDIIGPDHAEYEQARQLWNAMADRRPGLILRCTSTQDVVAAVGVAREHGLAPAVRCGGHNVAGKGMSDGGLTIDLSGLREVTVDPERKLVHVGGGCRLGDVDAATAPHKLIVAAGIMSETGVGGLSLGGGIGWFSRKHGLTCDNFVSLELVLASGEVIEVNADSHPELFWGLRGGGGNFGIVTRFTFQAYDFGPMMRIGVSVYEPEQANAALREYARVVQTLPRTVGWHAALKHDMPALPFVPPEYVGKRLMMLIAMWLDDAEDPEGAELITRLTETGEPCIKATTVLPFGAGVQRLIDVEFEDGHRYYTKEAHVADLADDAVDKLDAFWRNDMEMEGEVEIIGLGGAIGDVAEADSAFSNRGYLLWLNFAMRWDDPAKDPDYIARTRKIAADLAPWTGQGVYVNMLNFDEQDRVEEAMGGPQKYGELTRLKAQYDPQNLFRINANIPPAPKTAP
jgi:FAD/FMN-containing dehydrogenase